MEQRELKKREIIKEHQDLIIRMLTEKKKKQRNLIHSANLKLIVKTAWDYEKFKKQIKHHEKFQNSQLTEQASLQNCNENQDLKYYNMYAEVFYL
ncbi:hypothetical protein pb186bvf_008909 [Paramecium bursaria]